MNCFQNYRHILRTNLIIKNKAFFTCIVTLFTLDMPIYVEGKQKYFAFLETTTII